MEMHQVRYFLAVAEELNFTRAAERCNVAQPSLTRAIKLLEGELGGPLFNRERANTHLSELGRMVKPYLEQVYAQAKEAKRQALDFIKLKKTTLKLGVMCTIAPDQLVDLVCGVQSRNPGIELEIVDSSAGKLEERLIEGDLEVAIHCPPANQTDERLHYMPLYREQFLVALPAEHPLAEKNGIRPTDLSGLRYLNRVNCEFNGYAGAIWKECGLNFGTAYRSERDDWILAMVASLLYSAFVQTARTKERVESEMDRYHEIFSGIERIAQELSMAYTSAHRNPNEVLRTMTGHLREHYPWMAVIAKAVQP